MLTVLICHLRSVREKVYSGSEIQVYAGVMLSNTPAQFPVLPPLYNTSTHSPSGIASCFIATESSVLMDRVCPLISNYFRLHTKDKYCGTAILRLIVISVSIDRLPSLQK